MDGEGRLSRTLSTHGGKVAASPMVPSEQSLQAAPALLSASTALPLWHSARCVFSEYNGFQEQ